MSIKEKLQQIQDGRARQEAERVKREQEARELEGARLVAAEARKNAEIQRVKGILDSKGIPQMLEIDVLPILWEMGSSVALGTVAEEDVLVHRGGKTEIIKAVEVAVSGGGPKRSFNEYKYDKAKLGVFVEISTQKLYVCTGRVHSGSTLLSEAEFSLNDRHLKNRVESLLAEILSDPERFSWGDPEPPKTGADAYP